MFNIKEELKKLPDKPGVYIMKDDRGQVIYVGKAISLKKRVRQYFQSSKNKGAKVVAMVENINEFEYIITDTEVEALILEANLIKKHKPKYNVLLRDDKQYPYIKVTTNEKYPRVLKVRKVRKDKAKYFGPYISNFAVNNTLDIIGNLYPIRNCNLNLDKDIGKHRPCLNYYINKCLAPCQGNVDEEVYMEMINEIMMFLSGKEDKLIDIIQNKMKEASKNLDFENAAKYRDQINSLKHVLEKQKVISTTMIDQDIIGMARGVDEVCIQIFFVRSGKIMGREHFMLTGTDDKSIGEVLSSFTKQFYLGSAYVPKEILVEDDFEDREAISRWLSEKRGSKVFVKIPQRGEKNKLVDMVKKNARQTLEQYSENIKRKMNNSIEAVRELAKYLDLDEIPQRIEAFDISNIQGVESVASMVVFEKGLPKKSDYRRFKIKSITGSNDYGSMEEVVYRRFNRGIEEKKLIKESKIGIESFSVFPDLVMIDGGKGQVNIAKKVLDQLNLDVPVCGLVKDDFHRTRGIIYENQEIALPNNSSSFKLVTRIQDEAHRFAINYHRSLRDKKMFKSILDDIKGIGNTRKKALLKSLGSIDNIKKATVEELSSIEGMNKRAAQSVYDFFRGKKG
ncbi:excinuclease ABC subunit UvrC [Sporosalibacterium faouarense]|uniref:excinuclease ABC subunit UvrC n=1 Tax=Sporosalibacterium faouarense TaxID=516123 RepID=UPI00192BFEB7|nr:excinuclease ABC subunit UvrC [Sporosalibacterium faouarense]